MRRNVQQKGLTIVVAAAVTVGCVVGAAGAACDLLGIAALRATIDAIYDPALFAECPEIDRNLDEQVNAADLPAVVVALGAPLPTATATVTPTPLQQPPVLPEASVYRTFVGFPIAAPVGAIDPEGQALSYATTGDLPEGATFDSTVGVLSWTPLADLNQYGPFYVPFTVTDAADTSASGQFTFKVSGLDNCTVPACDPTTGCTATLTALGGGCCAGGGAPRVAEPTVGCPAGRVLYAGRNTSGFGRLQNCDRLQVLVSPQSGSAIRLNFEARCIKYTSPVTITTRLETASDVFVNTTQAIALLPRSDGYARRLSVTINLSGDTSELEGAEADLTLTLKDIDGVTATNKVRLVLTFNGLPNLPDL